MKRGLISKPSNLLNMSITDVECDAEDLVRFSVYFPTPLDEKQKILKIHEKIISNNLLKSPYDLKITKKNEKFYLLRSKLAEPKLHDPEADFVCPKSQRFAIPQEETQYLQSKVKVRIDGIQKFIESQNRQMKDGWSLFPLGLSHSVGGVISLAYSAGINKVLKASGLYDALSYECGSSGGGWATMITHQTQCDADLIKRKIIEWQSKVDVDNILEKFLGLFKEIVQDLTSNTLSEQYFRYLQNMFENKPVDSWKMVQGPVPIVISSHLYENEKTKFEELVEFTPFKTYFERLKQSCNTATLTKNNEKLTLADINVATGYIFSIPLRKIMMANFENLNLPTSLSNTVFPPFEIDGFPEKKERLKLTDGGNLEFFPLLCLLRRGARFVIISMTHTQKTTSIMNLNILKKRVEEYGPELRYKPSPEIYDFRNWDEKEVAVFSSRNKAEATIIALQPPIEFRKTLTYNSIAAKHNEEEIEKIFNLGFKCCLKALPVIAEELEKLMRQ